MGILQLPKLHHEKDVAIYLSVSIDTVRRERRKGLILCSWVGNRPRYTDQQILDYLDNKTATTCQKNASKSESIGSPSVRIAQSGAQPGSTTLVDRQSVHHLAQQTFKTRKSS
jgi:hypothetical protein